MSLSYLYKQSEDFGYYEICKPILDDFRFKLWSGSSKKGQHHYGMGGLLTHTTEVVTYSLDMSKYYPEINKGLLFLSAFFHDVGKMWDYAPIKDNDYSEWTSTEHKYKIHHISRSALEFNKCAFLYLSLSSKEIDEVTHCILSHHGLREWGSPVRPKTQMSWLLHLCDGISARLNDLGDNK